jgi:hypothetical protein
VPNGILDEWLEKKAWNERRANSILDVAADSETVLEAYSLNRDVAVEKSELALERDLLLTRGRQHQPQKVAQLRHHSFGGGRIGRDQCHRAVERVEQEMRIELELERVHLRLHETGDYTLTFGGLLARFANKVLHPGSRVRGDSTEHTKKNELRRFIERSDPRQLDCVDRIDHDRHPIACPEPGKKNCVFRAGEDGDERSLPHRRSDWPPGEHDEIHQEDRRPECQHPGLRHCIAADDRRNRCDIDDWVDRRQPVGQLGATIPDQVLRDGPGQHWAEDDDVGGIERLREVRRVHERRAREKEHHNRS